MKKINIIYWITTGLFALAMIFSSISNVFLFPEAIELLSNHLGYPQYLIPFLGVAKILGAIAILIPGFSRLKEWAYAGLFFDLTGATYSMVAVDGFKPDMLGMSVFFLLFALSYIYYQKRQKASAGSMSFAV